MRPTPIRQTPSMVANCPAAWLPGGRQCLTARLGRLRGLRSPVHLAAWRPAWLTRLAARLVACLASKDDRRHRAEPRVCQDMREAKGSTIVITTTFASRPEVGCPSNVSAQGR